MELKGTGVRPYPFRPSFRCPENGEEFALGWR